MKTSKSSIDELHARKVKKFTKLAKGDLLAFTKHTMPRFRVNWHHRLLCQYLMRLMRGDITRLMVFMPPRSGKSELVSRRFPAFCFGQNPNMTIISTSYGDSLASMMNRDVQRIIDDPLYKSVFPAVGLNNRNVRTNVQGSYLRNNDIFEIVGFRGRYRSAGIGSGITGLGGQLMIIDDPIKDQKEADSLTYRDNLWNWYNTTFRTRMENRDGQKGRILITLTRWHHDDLAGRLLKQAKEDPGADQWTLLSFPAIKEDESNPLDDRKIGEALWPENQDLKDLSTIRGSDRRTWVSLYQQRPSPESGDLFKREWWKFYKTIPEDCDKFIISADLTFKDKEKSDYAVLQVWASRRGDFYLLDQVRAKMGYVAQRLAFQSLCAKWRQVTGKYIEDAANGAALVDDLKNVIPGIIPVVPLGSKLARAEAVSPLVESGHVYLPDPIESPWIHDYLEELASFPNGTNDDQVDATSQALKQLHSGLKFDWVPTSLTAPSKWL